MTNPLVLVISGQVSAGKTTAGKMLRDQWDFQYARISQAIRTRWDGPVGQKPPRSWYQETGMLLHSTIGQGALCRETLKLIRDPSVSFVIDGARWNEDIAFFKNGFPGRTVHVHITAPIEIRKERFEKREKDVTFEDADGHDVESEIASLAGLADEVFDNAVDEEELLASFLAELLRRHHHAR